jgi:hypothetical protein
VASLRVIMEGDGIWPDLPELAEAGMLINGMASGQPPDITFAALPEGTVEGRPSITIRLDFPDGRVVLAETTMRLFLAVARSFGARFPAET